MELFYPALALWDMCGKEEPTEEEVDKAIQMLGDADTIYDDVLREDVRNEFGFYDEEE